MKTNIIVVDDFYQNPDSVRQYALQQKFEVVVNYPGARTKPWLPDDVKETIQSIIQHAGGKITNWNEHAGYTGAFQICVSTDRTWIHADSYNTWAAVCYLTPNAPLSAGTALYRYKKTGEDYRTDNSADHYDGWDYTLWDQTDYIANKYNRIVLYRGNMYHASVDYFGYTNENGRLFQTFFFNTEY